jgi:hypothetical protein
VRQLTGINILSLIAISFLVSESDYIVWNLVPGYLASCLMMDILSYRWDSTSTPSLFLLLISTKFVNPNALRSSEITANVWRLCQIVLDIRTEDGPRSSGWNCLRTHIFLGFPTGLLPIKLLSKIFFGMRLHPCSRCYLPIVVSLIDKYLYACFFKLFI